MKSLSSQLSSLSMVLLKFFQSIIKSITCGCNEVLHCSFVTIMKCLGYSKIRPPQDHLSPPIAATTIIHSNFFPSLLMLYRTLERYGTYDNVPLASRGRAGEEENPKSPAKNAFGKSAPAIFFAGEGSSPRRCRKK